MAEKEKMAPHQKWAVGIGFPFIIVVPFVHLYFAYRAFDDDYETPYRKGALMRVVLGGEHVVDDGALLVARLLLVLWALSFVATLFFAIFGHPRNFAEMVAGLRGQRGDKRSITR